LKEESKVKQISSFLVFMSTLGNIYHDLFEW
jgi:hypothetical protein